MIIDFSMDQDLSSCDHTEQLDVGDRSEEILQKAFEEEKERTSEMFFGKGGKPFRESSTLKQLHLQISVFYTSIRTIAQLMSPFNKQNCCAVTQISQNVWRFIHTNKTTWRSVFQLELLISWSHFLPGFKTHEVYFKNVLSHHVCVCFKRKEGIYY